MNIALTCHYGNIKWWHLKGYHHMITVNWTKFLNGPMVLLFEWLLSIGLTVCSHWVVTDWHINVTATPVDVHVQVSTHSQTLKTPLLGLCHWTHQGRAWLTSTPWWPRPWTPWWPYTERPGTGWCHWWCHDVPGVGPLDLCVGRRHWWPAFLCTAPESLPPHLQV